MQHAPVVAGLGFKGVGKGVAEVEQSALACFTLVRLDDARLGAATLDNGVTARVYVSGGNRGTLRLEPSEELRVANEAVFDHLGVARQKLPLRQSLKNVHVNDHEPRLVERPDQVLALARVDAGLAAHGAVDLGQQGGWELNHASAPAQDTGGKSGEITHHTAAQRDDAIAAFDPRFQELVEHAFELSESLRALAGGNDDLAAGDAGFGECAA